TYVPTRASHQPQNMSLTVEHVVGIEVDFNFLPRFVFRSGKAKRLTTAHSSGRAFGGNLEQGVPSAIEHHRFAGERTVPVERESHRNHEVFRLRNSHRRIPTAHE